MAETMQKIMDEFAQRLFGKKDKKEYEEGKKIEYTITSVYPSKKIMYEAEKYL